MFNSAKSYHEAIRKAYASMGDVKYKPLLVKKTKKEVAKEALLIPVKAVVPINIEVPVKDVVSNLAAKEIENNRTDTEISEVKKVLYAQAIKNGFQLVNTKPSLVFLILKTDVKDVFILKDRNGLLYKKNNSWVAEYYKNGILITENYQIKF